MLSKTYNGKISWLYPAGIIGAMLVAMAFILVCAAKAAVEQKTFSSSEQAVSAFEKALKENNNEELLKIFGPDANELIYSGDPVADRNRRDMFIKAFDEQHKIEREDGNQVLIVGKNDWPFPIPIVEHEGKFVFDTNAGKDEILNRRIGQNELYTIEVLLAIVDAQREYAREYHDSNGLDVYAKKFASDPGKKNGLYWPTKDGEKPSPLGPLVASAKQEGYSKAKDSEQRQPYHGYFYKILTAQGPNASGGAFDYIVGGKMIGGFAVIAWPAEYGNSGVMTFIVNYDDVVYQKDLGENTEQEAPDIKLFDPDKTWTKVQ